MMYCAKCGAHMPGEDRFCTQCGAVVEVPIPAAPQPVAWQPTVLDPQLVRHAGFWRRFVAALIDGVIVGLIWFVVSGLYDLVSTRLLENTAFAPDGIALGRALWLVPAGRWLLLGLVVFLYFALPESTKRGASLGKLIVRLRVARGDGGRTGIVRSLLRTAFKPISALPLMLGFMIAGWNRKKRALHDFLSGSVVLRV